MTATQKISIAFLASLGFIVWGYCIGRYKVFPHAYIFAYIESLTEKNHVKIVDKIKNDLNIKPSELLWEYPPTAIVNSKKLEIEGLSVRRQAPLQYINKDHKKGYRAIFGAFDFEKNFWGGLLIDGDGEVIHIWRLPIEEIMLDSNNLGLTGKNVVVYAVALLNDGSIIFTLEHVNGGMMRITPCGELMWHEYGKFHHVVSPTKRNTFWTFLGDVTDYNHHMAEIDINTGEAVKFIGGHLIRKTNKNLNIFNLQYKGKVSALHGNDIEELSDDMSKYFPNFAKGDLLISYRTNNLVFVLDQNNLKIKWYHIGFWDTQHDPDWEASGNITTFSNNTRSVKRGVSEIISINPSTNEGVITYSGKNSKFYSSWNGDHQKTSYNTRMITSSTQGWVFEIDENNEIVYSFVNKYSEDDDQALHLSRAYRLSKDYFTNQFWNNCKY